MFHLKPFLSLEHLFVSEEKFLNLGKTENQYFSKTLRRNYLASKFILVEITAQNGKVEFLSKLLQN